MPVSLTIMMRTAVFICAVALLDLATSNELVGSTDLDQNLIFELTDPKDSIRICRVPDVQMYSSEIHNCFVDKKYNDGRKDLRNIVKRILERSEACIGNFTKNCRPNYKGFLVIMDKVIHQIKEYFYMYLEYITHERDEIKDLKCVESSLSNKTYQSCFEDVFLDGTFWSEEKFQKKVQKAVSCTSRSQKLCSKGTKMSLNRIVRTILRIKQSAEESMKIDVKPEPINPETTRQEPTNPETTRQEPTNPETTREEPTNPETTKQEPTNPETTKQETTNPETTKQEPTIPETTKQEPTIPETTKQEPTIPETTKQEPTIPETTKQEPTIPKTTKQEPTIPEFTKQESTKPETRRPEPRKPETPRPEPPKSWRWYDYIIQPVISVWNAVRSFFGF